MYKNENREDISGERKEIIQICNKNQLRSCTDKKEKVKSKSIPVTENMQVREMRPEEKDFLFVIDCLH